MPLLKAKRQAQPVMSTSFEFNFDDTGVDTAGVTKTFGSVFGDAIVFDFMTMPQGATIVGGSVIVLEQGVGPTAYTVDIGTATDPDAFTTAAITLLSADGVGAPLTLLVPRAAENSEPLQLTLVSSIANATAGKFLVTVEFVLDNRALENL